MPTTPGGLPYPATSDSPNGPSQFQALATAIENGFVRPVASAAARTALSGISTGLMVAEKDTGNVYVKIASGWKQVNLTTTDTGWLNLTPAGGVTVGGRGMKYRVIGGICYFNIGCTAAAGWAAGNVVTTFPVGARPTTTITSYTFIGAYDNVADSFTSLQITTSGQLTVTQGQSGSSIALVVSGSFPVG